MKRLLCRGMDMLAQGLSWMAGMAAIAMVLLIALEMVGRGVFAHSFRFTWEYVSYCLGILMFGGLGWTLRTGGHIRVTVLAGLLPQRIYYWVQALAHGVGAVLASVLALALIQFCLASFVDQSRSFLATETPLWIPQAFMALGAFGFALLACARCVLHLAGLPVDIQAASVASVQAHL